MQGEVGSGGPRAKDIADAKQTAQVKLRWKEIFRETLRPEVEMIQPGMPGQFTDKLPEFDNMELVALQNSAQLLEEKVMHVISVFSVEEDHRQTLILRRLSRAMHLNLRPTGETESRTNTS